MKKFILFLLTVLLAATAQSQKSPIKYGEIPMEDMKMTTYAQDSSASAVVLADFGIAFITVAGEELVINFERHTRIKILKKDGLDFANSSVLLQHSGTREEKISNLKASSYNLENGKIVESKISKEGIFKEKVNKSWDRQKFTVPNVKEGSVIEYSYKKISEFYWNFPNWQFQKSIPTLHSEYWAMIPDVFIYEKYMQGYVPVTKYEEKMMKYYNEDVKAYHYLTLNVPAFKEEPFITTEDDYLSRMNFALSYINRSTYQQEIMGTWAKFNTDLLEDEAFGKVIRGSGFLKDKTEELLRGTTDPLQKIAVISDYIKKNVEYDGDEDFYADPLKKIIEKKKGTSGDINLLFASMLEKAGIETDMVLISTRDHGMIRKEYPMRKQFNYAVCAVHLGDKTILVDATEKYLPYDVLPARCINGQGLVISTKNHGWMDITTKTKAKTAVNTDFTLDENGELKGTLLYARDGYDAQHMRESIQKDGEEKYVADFIKNKQWRVEKSEFADVSEIAKQAKEIHNVTIADHSTMAGDVIYLNPFVTSQIEENPFKSETRVYPVDYGNMTERIYICKINIPEGYAVDELPKSKVIALPGNAARFMYNAVQIGNLINITSNFQINKNSFAQNEYPNLREFYNQVVAKQAEQIVIKKK